MNKWSDESEYDYSCTLKINEKNKFLSDINKNYVDESYINKKKNVTLRKWRVKIV